MTPDEDRMPDRYAKMTKESLRKQIGELKEKRMKQVIKMNEFLKSLE